MSGQKGGQILTERQEEILLIITKNPTISREELVRKTGINQSAVQKHLAKLKEIGFLKKVGYAKGGHWEINQ